MKKQLITSICTLVLSLLGAFGLNQNYLNSSADYVVTESAENTQNIDRNQSLYGDNQKNATEITDKLIIDNNVKNNTEDTNSNKAAAEKKSTCTKDNKNAADNNTKNNANTAKNTDSKKQPADGKIQTGNIACNNANTEKQAWTQAAPAASFDAGKCRTENGKLYYENINLSNCKSISDVVKVLNSCGYNISADNIQNAGSLEDILANLNKSSGNTAASKPSTTGTAAPSKAPAATPAPSDTQASKPASSGSGNATGNTAGNTSLSSYASEVLRLVNAEREKAGLPALTTNSTLTAAANKRAQEIKQTFSHTRPNGSSCFTVLGEYGISYRTAGENIAYGQKTPKEVVNGWMNSPGHRANILKSDFGKVGIGVYESGGVYYWTQLFTD